jgi:hypothetical protein
MSLPPQPAPAAARGAAPAIAASPRSLLAAAGTASGSSFWKSYYQALLDEPQQTVENDDGKNDRRVDPQAQHQIGEPGTEKNVDKGVVELDEEPGSAS